jgi:glutamate synthase (NADPH/NADH) large chain
MPMMMLIPEAWAGNKLMDAPSARPSTSTTPRSWSRGTARRRVAFTDGRQIGATLDRNGLRPARYIVTDDDLVILASEAGVLPVRGEDRPRSGGCSPASMLLIDLEEGRIISDEEVKSRLPLRSTPIKTWLKRTQMILEELKPVEPRAAAPPTSRCSIASRPSATRRKTPRS